MILRRLRFLTRNSQEPRGFRSWWTTPFGRSENSPKKRCVRERDKEGHESHSLCKQMKTNTHLPQPFGIMKRSLGPQWWLPQQGSQDGQKRHAGAIQPLVEGPAGSKQPQHKQTAASENAGERVKQYARGSLEVALREVKESPEQCAQHIWERSRASNAHGPQRSREKTWETLATHAGFRSL